LAAPIAVAPPRQVVTVLHRLSGWKLLNWLATSGPPALEIDDLPSAADVHTNIVAGYISEDGRTVVARLPQAEAALESFSTPPPPGLFASNGEPQPEQSEFTVVMADGKRVGAKFVGLDASTGLSLLEAAEPLFAGSPSGDQGDTDDPTVGQRVLLYAPALAPKPAPVARPATPVAEGFIYLSIDQTEGRLTELKRAPSGRLFSVVAQANVSRAWTGAVATNEFGEVVGIVSQSGSGETQIVPVATMREARERVLKLRASAPQPWLGARGDASFRAPLENWINWGWKPESAMSLIQNRQGVFLTSVAPGTPAAEAGLRPGDVIARVGGRDVRSVEDLSLTLKEAGVGSAVDFTVWRALEPAPLKLPVTLVGTQNPALATAEAEERAARSRLVALREEVRSVRSDEQRLRADLRAADEAALARLSIRLRETEERLDKVLAQVAEAESRVVAARVDPDEIPGRGTAQTLSANAPTPLPYFGLNAIGLTTRSAARLKARGGLLVVSVRPESPAAASGLRAGDVIETVNGMTISRLELRRLLQTSSAAATLGVVRLGQRLTLTLPLSAGTEPRRNLRLN
jgi:S1-C subfamily serine protease